MVTKIIDPDLRLPVVQAPPTELYIETTNRCNLACKTCPQYFGMPEDAADLTLETVAYKYGLKANAEQTFIYRGDAKYYIPGIPWRDVAAGGSASYNFANGPAIIYYGADVGGVQAIYALSVCWHDPTIGL